MSSNNIESQGEQYSLHEGGRSDRNVTDLNSIQESDFENELQGLEREYTTFKNNEHENIDKHVNNNSGVNSSSNNNGNNPFKYDSINHSNAKTSSADYSNDLDQGGSSIPEHLYVRDYQESEISIKNYYERTIAPNMTFKSVGNYFLSLFPILKWMPHYNITWFVADLVAGITVGCVLVPQSMSYAQVATLPAQYGLYSSFIGAFIYCCFATSKDVCIGPVAVMSLETAKVIARVTEKLPADTEITAPVIATVLSMLCGVISLGLGLLRLGFLVELISLNAVAGFMTGSALNIVAGQVPALMGYNSKVNTRQATYLVIIDTLKCLPDSNINVCFGLIPLVILYLWKFTCSTWGPMLITKLKLTGRKKFFADKFFFYAQTVRNAVVIIVFTLISWGCWRSNKNTNVKMLGTVPAGLKDVGVMKYPPGLATKIAPNLPASVIVLLLEHISIAKSFGRINNYKVVPDQELVAIGVANLVGTFFNAYPATGSFSRSALKARCQVRTPFSGVFTGACVLLALYCFSKAFYFIPKATLSAVIIHAVSGLVASYKVTWNFWKVSPLDFLAFIITVFITVFASIEDGIYFAMCWSCALLLFKVAFPSGKFLGRVQIAEVLNPKIIKVDSGEYNNDSDDSNGFNTGSDIIIEETINVGNSGDKFEKKDGGNYQEVSTSKQGESSGGKGSKDFDDYSIVNRNRVVYHTKWVPLDPKYTRELNPDVKVMPPPPGVIVYKPNESWTYINCSRQYDIIFDRIKKLTRRGQLVEHTSPNDRPWNDPGEWHPPQIFKKFGRNKSANSVSAASVSNSATQVFSKLWRKKANINKDFDEDNLYNEPQEPIEDEVVEGTPYESENDNDNRPILKVLALDFSNVNQIDATGIQSLVDLRNAVNRYADRQVEFHFSGIISPWIKRGLIGSGFGTINDEFSNQSLIYGHTSYHIVNSSYSKQRFDNNNDIETQAVGYDPATGINTPFFHIETPDFSQWDI
ncbi:related to Sulfate permease 2 [Saccharomycodes ludwigii]|uniref:Related to Sulfate permease 2 n=1 Tax=Saccharomycodes ludwigii TaxID=36035 RepID=A0A376B4C2_9ASCO|nr:hypothetical protein SCDLUD_001707 [Saccharomycodes ludwigii]KAH3901923.1 hypothetical protein SCDLUD_001707 [Saccharomycodes ludwigii]SSD59546.1 related to Sulfate permease 2 [Saccharomycodes ludwigii]